MNIIVITEAARRAVPQGTKRVYNVAKEGSTVACLKAAAELGWRPDFRLP